MDMRDNASQTDATVSWVVRSPRRLRLVAGVALFVLGIVVVDRTLDGSSDFRGFHRLWAANLVSSTLPERQHGAIEEDPDPYPPITYVLFAPFGAMPLGVAGAVWFGVNLASTWVILRWTQPADSLRKSWIWAGLLVLPFWLGGMLLGQNGPLLMLLTLGGYRLAASGRRMTGGALLALATMIKVVPAVFLLPFLLRRDARTVGGFVLTLLVVGGGLGSLYFGPQTNLAFHTRWLETSLHGTTGTPQDPRVPDSMRCSTRLNNQSLEAVLARLLMDVPARRGDDPLYVNLLSVEASTWRGLRLGLTVILIGVAAVTLLRQRQSDPLSDHALMSLLMLGMAPIVWSHYYIWMFIPLCGVVSSLRAGERGSRWAVAAWVAALFSLGSPWLRAIGLPFWAVLAVTGWQTARKMRGESLMPLAPVHEVTDCKVTARPSLTVGSYGRRDAA